MSTESIIGLVVALAGVNLVAVLGATWSLAGRLARLDTKMERADSTEKKVEALDKTVAVHEQRLEQLEAYVEREIEDADEH